MWRLTRVFFLLMGITVAVNAVVIGIARLAYHDPFAPYMAVMPGQSIDALKDYPCQFRISTKTNTQWGVCEFSTDMGLFGQISLTAYGHVITQTYLEVQPNQLHLGDLMLCWGEPAFDSYGYQEPNIVARWGAEVFTEVPRYDRSADVSNYLTIQYLIIEGKWLPCRST